MSTNKYIPEDINGKLKTINDRHITINDDKILKYLNNQSKNLACCMKKKSAYDSIY
tara:strand:+ start:3355 stop:3522 length:168 start_codon:yes stop_codon:yes gene_type:complete